MNCVWLIFFVISIALTNYGIYGGMVNVCSEIKDCVKCTESYVNIFAFREQCRFKFV